MVAGEEEKLKVSLSVCKRCCSSCPVAGPDTMSVQSNGVSLSRLSRNTDDNDSGAPAGHVTEAIR